MDPTPRPWRIDRSDSFVYVIQDGTDGEAICTMGGLPEMFANAELIVTAVNSYSEAREAAFCKLVSAAYTFLDRFDRGQIDCVRRELGGIIAGEIAALRQSLKGVEEASK